MGVRRATALVVGLLLVSCSSGGAETSTTASSAASTTMESTSGGEPTTTTIAAPASTSPEPDVEFGDVVTVDVVVLDEVGPGPHPVLGWEAIDGASSYWVMVSDADGAPYWAWTGVDNSVRVGGGDTEETNQTAVVHENMTWRVAAFDESGTLIAISETGSLSP